ncbi:thioesterase II family protein [Acinetobacter calcoaceticus]|uniref:thioesterase II family protein n=1 Tax=Acinetobacter calcoaceticus TaxID=471 RepID=UPI003009CD97
MNSEKFYYIPKIKNNIKRRLFCFPFAGGLANYYFSFEKFVPDDLEIVAIQYPGRFGNNDQNIHSIDELVNFIYNRISHLLDLPFSFFGHSMGAIVAYELSKRMQNNFNIIPQYLFLSGRSAPENRKETYIHTMNDVDLVNKLISLSGIPNELISNNLLLEQFLPAIRNDIKLIETWCLTDKNKLKIPFILFNGDSDPEVNINEVGNWSLYTFKNVVSHIFSGNHFFINQHKEEIIHLILNEWTSYTI